MAATHARARSYLERDRRGRRDRPRRLSRPVRPADRASGSPAFFLESGGRARQHACDYLLACDMEMDAVPGYAFTSWEKGYGDFHCVPDLATLRRAAWLPRTALVLCDVVTESRGRSRSRRAGCSSASSSARARWASPPRAGPRSSSTSSTRPTLRRGRRTTTTSRPSARYIEDYHILQAREEPGRRDPPRPRSRAACRSSSARASGGPASRRSTWRYSEALDQADRNVIYKHAAKEIAWAQGQGGDLHGEVGRASTPAAALHMHISLWDATGEANLFPGDGAARGDRQPDTFRWFLGGLARARAPSSSRLLGALRHVLQAVTRRGRSRRPRSPGATTTVPPASGSSAGHVAADRVPHPGRRCEPVHRLRRGARRRPRRHRRSDRAAASSRATSTRPRSCRGARHAARGDPLDSSRAGAGGVRRGRRSSTTSTSCGPSSGSSTRSSRAGNGPDISREAEEGLGRLENKVAVITGAGSGIGRESALLFAQEGARVVVADVNDTAGRKVVDELGAPEARPSSSTPTSRKRATPRR